MLRQVKFHRFFLSVLALAGLAVPAVNAATVLTNPNQFSGAETLLTFQGAGVLAGDDVSSFGGVGFSLANGSAAQFRIDGTPRQFGPGETSAIDNITGQTSPFRETRRRSPGRPWASAC